MNTFEKNMARYMPPDWGFRFHGHRCPFMPLGYRMGIMALERMGLEREKNHGLHVFPELGEGHPQACLVDGIQIATGATLGKTLVEKTFWGKMAATFWYKDKTPIRFLMKPDFLDGFAPFEFFAYRKRGVEPSDIPPDVTQEVLDWTLSVPDEDVYEIMERPDFVYTPPRGSFNKTKCSICGEYVFERYVRILDGKPVCIPCSGYRK